MRSDLEVRDEVHALWAAVFGEPPIVEAPTKVLIDTLVASLPTTDYDTLRRVEVMSPPGVARAPAAVPMAEERSFDDGSGGLGRRPAPAHSPARVSGPSSE